MASNRNEHYRLSDVFKTRQPKKVNKIIFKIDSNH